MIIKKQGIKLECDYPHLPFYEKTVTIEGITVDSTQCLLYQHSIVGTMVLGFDRKMEARMVAFY